MKRIVVSLVVVLISIGCWASVYKYCIVQPEIDPALTAILADPSIKTGTKDKVNNLGVQSIKDVAYYEKGDYVTIHYGKQSFTITRKQIENKTLSDALAKLSIKAYYNKNNKLIVTYGGKRVDEWVMVK